MQGPISKSYISLEGLKGGLLLDMMRAMDLVPREVNGFDTLTSEEQQVYLAAMETHGTGTPPGMHDTRSWLCVKALAPWSHAVVTEEQQRPHPNCHVGESI